MKTRKPYSTNFEVDFEIQLSPESELLKLTGTIIEELPNGKVKVEYVHPVQGNMIKIVSV